MMTEIAIPNARSSSAEDRVRFVGPELRKELLRSFEAEGWIPVSVEVPGAQNRGRLGLLLEEALERSLESRGACPPGIGASADSDASLSDQLYRARLLGAPGFALALESLGSIANRAGALDAEDSAVLRWWVMTARERPLRLFFDASDRTLGVYTAPTHFWRLIRDSAEIEHCSEAPPVNEELASNLISMQAATEYVVHVRSNGTDVNADTIGDATPQVEEAPVQALVNAGVLGDGGLRDRGGRDVEGRQPDLDAAELHPLVVLELAGRGEEGALGQSRDGLGERVRILRSGVHELHRARLVAQHDELHLLLIAHRIDPPGHGHGSVGQGGEVLDEGASHERTAYRRPDSS